MDSEENAEIQKAAKEGHPQTDEGPYYHEAWWEAYKGSVKGKLGGSIIGAAVGAVVGIAAVGVLAATIGLGAAPLSAALMITAGFSAGGMIYGAHEFSDIGKNVGSTAAIAEKLEQRENVRFAALERKIDELKAMLSGKKAASAAADPPAPAATEKHPPYRTTHCDEHCPPDKPKFIFWKVAAIGLAVGLAAGALLAAADIPHVALEHLGKVGALLHGHELAAAMTAMGLFGASFGINRDMFRQVFDRTDLMFKGILHKDKSHALHMAHTQHHETAKEKLCGTAAAPIITVVYPDQAAFPQSDTFHRDRLAESTKLALLNMDHSKAIRQ